jgi:hypothetical protein
MAQQVYGCKRKRLLKVAGDLARLLFLRRQRQVRPSRQQRPGTRAPMTSPNKPSRHSSTAPEAACILQNQRMVQHTSINSVPTASAVIPALRRASAATGVDFNFLLEQARTESSLNPKAQASTSSARGLFQFIDSTWLDVIDKHGAKHGLDAAAASISRDSKGRPLVNDAAQRAAILKLRDDPYISGLMAGELAQDNAAKLQQELGRAAKPAELYMAHFLGAGGAASFLSGMEENPDIEASYIVPAAARANQAVFYKSGKALSLDEVYARFEGKFDASPDVLAARTAPVADAVTPAARAPLNAATLAAQAAIFAAQQTLQLGAETAAPATSMQEMMAASDSGLKTFALASTAAGIPVRPTPYGVTPFSPTTRLTANAAATLMALQVLQSMSLPGEEDAPAEQLWRA